MRKTILKSSKSTVQANDTEAKSTVVRSVSMASGGSKQKKVAEDVLKHKSAKPAAEAFHFRELAGSADNFDPDLLIGEGALGRVYKGRLKKTNQVVAMKQLDMPSILGNKEFLAEVMTLSLIDHPNLVNLVGYCADGNQRILVYEFMSNGSLENHLLDISPDRKPLDWYTRMRIAKGAAQGLEYLHDMATPPIIYRDFKTSNILLDESFNPKLSDFGLAKLGPVDGDSGVSTRVVGTYGYCAPEYVQTGQLTSKSDVYSFGVVLLEIITGRRAIDNTRPIEEQHLVTWARPYFGDKSKVNILADPLLAGEYPTNGLYQATAVAAMCLQEESSTRPLIGDVATALDFLSMEIEVKTEESVKTEETVKTEESVKTEETVKTEESIKTEETVKTEERGEEMSRID